MRGDTSSGRMVGAFWMCLAIGVGGLACSNAEQAQPQRTTAGVDAGSSSVTAIAENPLNNAYFGDLHVHTVLSFDAYLFGTRRTPDDAYRFAKGEAIEHASGFSMQLKKPLDFLGVSDHGFYLGMMRQVADPDYDFPNKELAAAIRGATDPAGSQAGFNAAIAYLRDRALNPDTPDVLDNKAVARSAWQEIIASAARHNDPGNFTAFIAYEYTSSGPAFENLHRNVVFRGAQAPELPFTRLDSLNPEDLWDWMDAKRDEGFESIAIPHNSNGSNGWMFQLTNQAGDPIDAAYAEQRMRNEPLVENTQVKGTSDTHPLLSPNDEWADFEIMPIRVASSLQSQTQGSYVREAYLNGIAMESADGVNPYKFGVIGSSDTHNAAGSFDEDNYWSKTGVIDIEPQQRASIPLSQPGPDGERYAQGPSQYWGASGLAGVWASANTRDAIFDAFRRKETFSTSGPHIKVRFFAGYDMGDDLLDAPDNIERLYASGVPMGADLMRNGDDAPAFFAWAARDPDSGSLQRLQVIKGWVDDGETQERVFDIACSDGGAVDGSTHRCPDNGARVDLTDCSVTPDKGAAELSAVWEDPDFDPDQRAFYYVRVLENPICRWSTWDAVRAGVTPRDSTYATVQDRAWTSPIWYQP